MRSGISKARLARAGVRHVGAAEAAKLCPLAKPGLWLPCGTLSGVAVVGTVKEVVS